MISFALETLQFWCERMLDTGVIDRSQYEAYKEAGQSYFEGLFGRRRNGYKN